MAWNIKNCNFVTESGRSMIEMLGVLAVIGVLSVAGLAGYSKAIERYKVNETINQITYIVQNTRDLFKTQPNLYGGLAPNGDSRMSTSTSANRILADKVKLFPAALVKNNYKNLWDGDIEFGTAGRFNSNDGKAFLLGFYGIPQEVCIEIATKDWQSNLGLVAMRIRGSSSLTGLLTRSYSGNCSSIQEKGDALICAKDMPITVEQAVIACDKDKDNGVFWKFY